MSRIACSYCKSEGVPLCKLCHLCEFDCKCHRCILNISKTSIKNVIVFGFHGEAGSGKDTAAASVVYGKDPSFLAKRFAFADKLKGTVIRDFKLTHEQVYDEFLKNKVDPRYGKTPREILQQVGDAYRAIDPLVFVKPLDEFIARLDEERTASGDLDRPIIVGISDVRFPNEAIYVKGVYNGTITKIIRPCLKKQSFSSHISEQAIPDIYIDEVIVNKYPVLVDSSNEQTAEKAASKFKQDVKKIVNYAMSNHVADLLDARSREEDF
jgi:hypothetical protein